MYTLTFLLIAGAVNKRMNDIVGLGGKGEAERERGRETNRREMGHKRKIVNDVAERNKKNK